MLTRPPSGHIYLPAGVTDLRKSFDGLSGLGRNVLRQDPLSGHLFVFYNRRRDRRNRNTFPRTSTPACRANS